MAVVRTQSTGFLGNLMSSIVAVPVGILLFLASFVVLFQSEGCTNFAEVAAEASVVDGDTAGGHDGEFVSVTGTLTVDEQLGDPEYLQPGNYVRLDRVVEQYVWVEHKDTETRDKVGGGTETVTTYTYNREWTSDPPDSSRFEDPNGHQNPPQRIQGDGWSVSRANIGAWSFDVGAAGMPGTTELSLSTDMLRGGAAQGEMSGVYVYMDGSSSSPTLGDHRISWRAIEAGGMATGFGLAQGSELRPYNYEDDETWLGVRHGDREQAISTFQGEYTMMMWGLRLGGFLMMWIGMGLVFSPLHAIAGILPFLKKGSKALVSIFTFPVALVLTIITIIVAKILHSLVAMIVIGVLFFGGLVLGLKLYADRKKDDAGPPAAAPPMGPPAGPPAGPPPGAPPAG